MSALPSRGLEPLADPDARALWARAVAGDVRAFERLFRALYPLLYNYARRLTADEAVVEDLLQDLFADLWVQRSRLADLQSPKAYLLTSVRHGVERAHRDATRRRARSDRFAQAQEVVLFSHEEVVIEGEMEDAQRALLQHALAALTPRQREALYLRYYAGLGYDEIAALLAITNQSARNTVSRALGMLRETLPESLVWTLLLAFCRT